MYIYVSEEKEKRDNLQGETQDLSSTSAQLVTRYITSISFSHLKNGHRNSTLHRVWEELNEIVHVKCPA